MFKKGFSLIELILVIVIIGIVSTVGMRAFNNSIDNRKYLATITEMNELRKAMIGDEELISKGSRVDFGYVGSNGVFPANLAALSGEFAVNASYAQDAWGNNYIYTNAATVTIQSMGADGVANAGTGLDEDIFLRLRRNTYQAISVGINVFDLKGNMLLGNSTHISQIRLLGASNYTQSGGAGNLGLYVFSVPQGEYNLEVSVVAAYRTALNEGNATYTVPIIVYPRGAARRQIVSVRLPGALE